MARLKKRRKPNKEDKPCKRCGKILEEGNFRWCDNCQKELKLEYKDQDPISEYELHYLPSLINNDSEI